MQDDFGTLWRLATNHEANGDLAAAHAIYETILRTEPRHLQARLRASTLEQVFGHYRQSRAHALGAADAVRNGQWQDIGVVTRRLLAFDEHEVLRDLILAADWKNHDILRNSPLLAQHLYLIDRVDDALDLIDAVSARVASSHPLSYAKANALRYSGRMDEAAEEYERCIRLQPDYPYAHWALAYHRKADPPLSRIDRIRKAQAVMDTAAPEQAYLHYALFKEYDDADEVGSAWQSLVAGARIKRHSIRYDPGEEQRGFDALQRLVDGDFVGNRNRARASDKVPIFIVGMPRTGTTLLERILGNHSQVTTGGELRDFNTALCQASDSFIGSSARESWVERLKGLDFGRVGEDYLQRTDARSNGRRYLVDKNPVNFIHAGHIAKALPQARILCLQRSAMDACFSNLKELFTNETYGYSYDTAELADHYARFSALRDHWQRIMPEQFHIVDYEDLVSDPLGSSERIMRFCGLDFEPKSIDITQNKTSVATASSSQIRQPIYTRGVGAWRKYAAYLEPLRVRLEQATSTTPD